MAQAVASDDLDCVQVAKNPGVILMKVTAQEMDAVRSRQAGAQAELERFFVRHRDADRARARMLRPDNPVNPAGVGLRSHFGTVSTGCSVRMRLQGSVEGRRIRMPGRC